MVQILTDASVSLRKKVTDASTISFRTERVTNSNEVMGYQADMGYLD